MHQSGKKNLPLFEALQKEMAAKAKTAGNTDVPNLQESLVEKPKIGSPYGTMAIFGSWSF